MPFQEGATIPLASVDLCRSPFAQVGHFPSLIKPDSPPESRH